MKSGTPGGTISARGSMRVIGSPSSSSLRAEAVCVRLLVAVERLGRAP